MGMAGVYLVPHLILDFGSAFLDIGYTQPDLMLLDVVDDPIVSSVA